MQKIIWSSLFVITSSLLLFSGCTNVRLQTAEQFSENLYIGQQAENYAKCLKDVSSSISDCQQQKSISYDDYRKEREILNPKSRGL